MTLKTALNCDGQAGSQYCSISTSIQLIIGSQSSASVIMLYTNQSKVITCLRVQSQEIEDRDYYWRKRQKDIEVYIVPSNLLTILLIAYTRKISCCKVKKDQIARQFLVIYVNSVFTGKSSQTWTNVVKRYGMKNLENVLLLNLVQTLPHSQAFQEFKEQIKPTKGKNKLSVSTETVSRGLVDLCYKSYLFTFTMFPYHTLSCT